MMGSIEYFNSFQTDQVREYLLTTFQLYIFFILQLQNKSEGNGGDFSSTIHSLMPGSEPCWSHSIFDPIQESEPFLCQSLAEFTKIGLKNEPQNHEHVGDVAESLLSFVEHSLIPKVSSIFLC